MPVAPIAATATGAVPCCPHRARGGGGPKQAEVLEEAVCQMQTYKDNVERATDASSKQSRQLAKPAGSKHNRWRLVAWEQQKHSDAGRGSSWAGWPQDNFFVLCSICSSYDCMVPTRFGDGDPGRCKQHSSSKERTQICLRSMPQLFSFKRRLGEDPGQLVTYY
ncbi:LOW QUALITY PROTEIN: hypothetical protein U9M48_004050 [Paspalum notatum var. saurae]|uniref:Uncharacterized protein n=1 Tax=Paspalum notatum var. saurae TaxID=547442 RepID=A0AAQ3PM50_PASNO